MQLAVEGSLKGRLHETFCAIYFTSLCSVCNVVFVKLVFENKNNLLVKKRSEKQDSKPVYGFFRFVVITLLTSQVEPYKGMTYRVLRITK